MKKGSKDRCCSTPLLVLGLLVMFSYTQAWMHVTQAWRRRRRRRRATIVHYPFPPQKSARVQSAPLTSSSALAAVWQVGDKVWVTPASGDNYANRLAAIVTNVQGRGWYTVELSGSNSHSKKEEPNSTFKVRSTRLQTRDNVPHGVAAPPISGKTRSDWGNGAAKATDWSHEDLPVVDPTQMFRPQGGTIDDDPSLVATPPQPPLVTDLDAVLEQAATATDTAVTASPDNSTDAFVEQARHHAQTTHWVVFTDLHVAPSTLETCLQVLDQVHEVAVGRQAGIVFLGDFWHHRGTLRVDCLDAVLERLKQWKVPLVMIPGNHDQVTLGGHVHGLTALRNAYSVATANGKTVPGPLIFSHPTVFRRALWIPHVRDNNLMESILQSSYAQSSVRAILCHADVTGASMNDLLVSTGGVPPHLFPPHLPIYSGHFHKAHSVSTRNHRLIEYLGSPYQVSLSEAYQPKALAVMDQDWQVCERIPLHLGRFHFKPTTQADFMALKLAPSRSDAKDNVVCAGDRVVWSVDAKEWENLRKDDAVEQHIQKLRQADVAVEIRPSAGEQASSNPSLELQELEELTPTSTWEAFVDAEIKRGAWSKAHADQLRVAGLGALASVEGDEQKKPVETEAPSTRGSRFEFRSLTISGFGPFQSTVDYSLNQRGLVLVRGTNQDSGSDSNGTGKSSLAMASLWALTGALDPRPLPDGRVTDVVHDNARAARVTLRGTHNGNEFTITRSKTKARGSLTFFYDDQDRTTQSVRETQVVIDEILGISPIILFRSVFFGQHPLNDLLDASDTRFKEELSLLVPLATWQEVLSATRKRAKACEKRIAELDGMISIRKGDLNRVLGKLEKANENFQLARQEFVELEESLAADVEDMKGMTDPNNSTIAAQTIERATESLSLSIELFEKEREKYMSDREAAVQKFGFEVNRTKEALQEAARNVTDKQRALDIADLKYQNMVQDITKLEVEWQIDLGRENLVEFMLPSACPTCGQPLSGESTSHAHSNIQEAIGTALANRQTAAKEQSEAKLALSEAEAFHSKRLSSFNHIEDTKAATFSWIENRIKQVETEIRKVWREREKCTIDLAEATRKRQAWVEAKSAQQKLDSEREALNRLEAAAESIDEDKRRCEEMIESLKADQKRNSDDRLLLKELANAFGQRGIQVFVLRNALEALQAVSQTYLDELSDSTLELRLVLDDGDRILRQVCVSSGSERNVRSLSSLSGGQWRRCSLALQLGFADLLSRRGKFGSSLLVFDEPLTHLDRSGRSAFGRVLRGLLLGDHSTILLILQDLAAEELEETFDAVDEVVKSQGRSFVNIYDGNAAV